MANPTVTYFSNLVPPGVYPPASVRWAYFSATVPAGAGLFVVPWQPGTPPGVLVPISWLVTDIFLRVECRKKIKALKNKTDLFIPDCCQFIIF